MQFLRHIRCASLLAGVALVSSLAFAQDKAAKPGEMSPEEKAMMEKWGPFMTPGEPHKMLASKVGTWSGTVTTWMAPGAPPNKMEGSSEYKMIMDGRYLEDNTSGNFNGMPFMGHGLTGYDNMKKKYVSTWIDNMGTGIMVSEGTYDPATKTTTMMGESPDVMSGKYQPMKMVDKMDGPDHMVMEMYYQTPDGKGWWKTMQIDYTRKK